MVLWLLIHHVTIHIKSQPLFRHYDKQLSKQLQLSKMYVLLDGPGKEHATEIMSSKDTHSVDSIRSEGVRIIMRQLMRMVAMMMRENRGWTSTWMATRRTGEKGDRNHIESSAENLKMSFPLLITMKV